MRWARHGDYLAVSDSVPPYKVAKFINGSQAQYRASMQGEFIGAVTDDPREAQAICERHHSIMGSVKGVAA